MELSPAPAPAPADSLRDLLRAVDAAEELRKQTEEKMHNFLRPILTALGLNMIRCGIAAVGLRGSVVEVEYCWTSRGYADSEGISFPVSVAEAADPVAAAREYAEGREQEKKKRERDEKIAQLKKLTDEIMSGEGV